MTMPNTPQGPQDSAGSLPARPYDRPIPGRLVVQLDDGGQHYATPADLEKWGYVDRYAAYGTFRQALQVAVTMYGPMHPDTDLTDALLNPMRYLVELALVSPKELIELAEKAAAADDTWPEPETDETAAALANVGALEHFLGENRDAVEARVRWLA